MDGKKIRILMVLGNTKMGGAQAFLLNVLRNIDRSVFQIDLAINYHAEKDGIEDECRLLGCDIFIVPYFKVYNYMSYCKAWHVFFDKHPYDIVHAHSTNSASVFLKIAKKHGCKTIAHSHSAGYRGNKVEQLTKKIFVKDVGKVSDYWFACSDKAAERLYGKGYQKYPHYYGIPNAINADQYLFSQEVRQKIREQMGVDKNTFLCGHVGTFSVPKNHAFLLDIFKEVLRNEPDAKMVLCGAGPLKFPVEKKAKELGVFDKIIFAGVVNNVNEYLMAMDAFVFPSIFEGFPISILEAEATGLHIVMSDVITKEVELTDLIHRHSLTESPSKWAKDVLTAKGVDRKCYNKIIVGSNYNMRTAAKRIENLYVELVNS